MPLPITEKLIQRQINHWNRFREFLPEPVTNDEPLPGPIITVSRQAGSGGRALANALAHRLGLQMHDHDLVEKIARDSNLEKEMITRMDEKAASQARLWVRGVLNQKIFLRDQYHLALVKVVTGLAAQGNVLFLGRGANLILGKNATLRVRVVASRPTRMEYLRSRTGLSRPETRALLNETDRQRSDFIRKVFREKPGNAENFDLVLNSDQISLDCQVEMVLLALLSQQTGEMKADGEVGLATNKAAGG